MKYECSDCAKSYVTDDDGFCEDCGEKIVAKKAFCEECERGWCICEHESQSER